MKYDEKTQPTSWSESPGLKRAEEMAAQEVPKPYTVPPGYKPPSMGEQWLYATRRHPYYRYGYAAVALIGLGLYAMATINRVEDVHREARKPKPT